MKLLLAIVLSTISVSAWSTVDLAKKHGCMACHAVDRKVLGPSFRDVANKYTANDANKIAQSIRAGGMNRWGSVPMPAQSHVSQSDAESLARWILTQK